LQLRRLRATSSAVWKCLLDGRLRALVRDNESRVVVQIGRLASHRLAAPHPTQNLLCVPLLAPRASEADEGRKRLDLWLERRPWQHLVDVLLADPARALRRRLHPRLLLANDRNEQLEQLRLS